EGRFRGDARRVDLEGEASVVDLELDMLRDLVLVDDLAHPHADGVSPLQGAARYHDADLRELLDRGLEQRLPLVRPELGELRIATGHQPLAREVRMGELEAGGFGG